MADPKLAREEIDNLVQRALFAVVGVSRSLDSYRAARQGLRPPWSEEAGRPLLASLRAAEATYAALFTACEGAGIITVVENPETKSSE